MENYLPCECLDSANDCYYISIAKENKYVDKYDHKIPEGILNFVIETEPTQFYILYADSSRYIISRDSKNEYFELTLKDDTLLLMGRVSNKKFIKSEISFDFFGNKYNQDLDNITLLNKSLLLRGYQTIQVILKEDSLKFHCNAWVGNVNRIYSPKNRKSWVLEISNGYLNIAKVTNPNGDPLDPIKTRVIKKLKWVTNVKERIPRREEYPVWSTWE